MFAFVFHILVRVQSGVSAQQTVVSCILLQESFLVCLLFGENFFFSHIVHKLRRLATDSFGNINHMASRGLICVNDFLAPCFLGIEPILFPFSYLSIFKMFLCEKKCNPLQIVLEIGRRCHCCIAVVVSVTEIRTC